MYLSELVVWFEEDEREVEDWAKNGNNIYRSEGEV